MHRQSTFVKVPGLWFDDGNLILQAEDSIYRIYRGLLCARSSVFADMFSFPAPAEGNDTMDGCPMIHTYDSAQDMTYFLTALLDSHFFEPPPAPTRMPIVSAVLRLASKYDVHHLRLRAMQHLLTTYPTTLQAWKTRDVHRTIPGVENTPFVALKLAREFDMPWVVPSIAYCICSHDLNKTLEGADWPAEPACVGVSSESEKGEGGESETPGELVKLAWGDQKMCINGRHNLLIKQNKQALALAKPRRIQGQGAGTPPLANAPAGNNAVQVTQANTNTNDDLTNGSHSPTECPSPAACSTMRFHCAEILTRWGTAGILNFLQEQSHAFSPGFCDGCLAEFQAGCGRAATEMWDSLPALFELGTWDDLERVKELTMR